MEWLKRLGAAIDYIEENLDREISYDEVARMGIHPQHPLTVLFKAYTG